MKRFYLLLFLLLFILPTLCGQIFESHFILYRVTSTNPNLVEVCGYLGEYGVSEGSTYALYPGQQVHVTIPSVVTNEKVAYSVTSIASEAFYTDARFEIYSVSIPSSVKSIGDNAFRDCSYIESISFSEGLLTIGEDAFCDCTALTSVTLPNSTTSIGAYAFSQCEKLASVTFNEGLLTIGENAFEDCTALTSVTLPNSVTHIGDYAFQNCTNLQYVYFGNNLRSDDTSPSAINDMFNGCSDLTIEWNVKGEHELIPLSYSNSITKIIFGEDVTMIPEGFCEGMTSLTSITISDGITKIPNRMCDGCTALSSITIPNTITSIGNWAFEDCTAITSITLPHSVTTIGAEAFSRCEKLASVTFNEGLLTIGENAFEDCTALTSITLPNSVTTIGDWAFRNCTSLQYAYLGHNLNSIGLDIFFDCSDLIMEWNVKGTHKMTPFMSEESITSVIFGDDVSMIPDRFCEDMTSLTSIAISDGITKIPNRMCDGCTALSSITIPNTITSIGEDAFLDCTALTSVTLPNSITSIGAYAFCQCEKLASVTFNEGLLSIGQDAFSYCTSIDSIILPNSITNIGDYAFQACSKLTYAQIDATVPPTLGGLSIFKDTKLKAIHIPCGTKKAYKASDWNDLELKFAEIGNGFSLSVGSADITMGDVVIILEPTSCDNNEAEIEAIPEDGYRFSHWSDGTDANPYLLTLTQDTTLIAFFEGGNCDDVTSTLYLSRGWVKEIYPVDDWYQLYCYEAQENGEEYRMIIQNQSSETVDFSIDFFVSCDSEDATYSYAKALNPEEVLLLPFDYSNLVECYIHAVANGEVLVEWVQTDCGENLYWDYADEHLTITGTGDMYDYVFLFDMAPWANLPVSEISLPEGMTYIGAFGLCAAGITSINIPSTVTKIGDAAFWLCVNLQSITISQKVTSIGLAPFVACYNLQSIVVEEGNKKYDSRDNCNAIIHTASNALVAGCPSTIIPESIVKINDCAFAAMSEFAEFATSTSLTIPINVTNIGESAFEDSYVDTLYMESLTPPAIDSTTFNTYPICYVPYAALETYQNSEWANYMGEINGYHLTLDAEYATICFGETYEWYETVYTETGVYTQTTDAGIATLYLTVLPKPIVTTDIVTISSSDIPYIWRGKAYSVSGQYSDSEKYSVADCDSIVHILDLTVLSTGAESTDSVYVCENNLPYEWFGESLFHGGVYTYTEQYEGTDIDSIKHTLYLVILQTTDTTEKATICDGETYIWNGCGYSTTGEYTITLSNMAGCDSIVTLHLTVLPATITKQEELVLCPLELPYNWYGLALTEAGIYSTTEQNSIGCDSVIHELTLNVYVQTLPEQVTLPVVREGEAIEISIPTADIQAHIAAEEWYAPNALVEWYIQNLGSWEVLTAAPLKEGIDQVVLKYVVDSDCGSVESNEMIISVKNTAVENIQSSGTDTYKMIYDDKLWIIRNGKMYNVMGQEL